MEAKKLNMIMSILKIVLGAIGVIACLLIVNGPNMEDTKEVRDAFRDGGEMGLAINYTVFVVIATAAAVILFFILGLVTNTRKTVMSIVGVVAAFILFCIFWAAGSSDTHDSLQLAESIPADAGTINFVTAGLWTVMVGVVVGALAAILSPLMGRFRK